MEGWFSDGYKWRRHPITGKRRFHRGLDIVASAGSVVRAPADGIVTHAARAGSYGNMIELDHKSRFKTRFAHLARFLVGEGEKVRLGDAIGLVGATGQANGPHLHYEVLENGRRVNPWRYLGERNVDPEPIVASLDVGGGGGDTCLRSAWVAPRSREWNQGFLPMFCGATHAVSPTGLSLPVQAAP